MVFFKKIFNCFFSAKRYGNNKNEYNKINWQQLDWFFEMRQLCANNSLI